MTFQKKAIALIIGSLCAGVSVASMQNEEANSRTETVQSEINTPNHYTVVLKSSFEQQPTHKVNSAQIAEQQALLISYVKTLDPLVKVNYQTKLLGNLVTFESRLNLAEALAEHSNVASVHTYAAERTLVKPQSADRLHSAIANTATSDPVIALTPYNNDVNAGSGASVAIISTGVDYTLKFFGGSGELGDDNDPETPPAAGSYLEALEHGAIEYAGFPTPVIAGGWDFASENYGNDANPIDQYYHYESWNGWQYPTGLGTKLASIVHQLAPGAKIHAYKVMNVNETFATGASLDRIVQAIEHALDPNQDGDTSDHLDVALLDADGAAAFYAGSGTSSFTLSQYLIEKASGLGLTIVADSGDLAEYGLYDDATEKHRYWLAPSAASTSSISVGSIVQNDESYSVSSFSPKGPVRGSKALKPELVSFGENQPVAEITKSLADGGGSSTDTRFTNATGGVFAAARIAAAAAVIKANNRAVGPAEIKALLANTATNPGIKETGGDQSAELYSVGHGMENIEAAIATPVFTWDAANNQPYLQFGTHEVHSSKRITKDVFVRNLSDKAQTYTLSYNNFGDAQRLSGINVTLPEQVNIPAGRSVTFSVTIDIDASELPAWPLMNTVDFTDENLKKTELNGYITFSAENQPDLNLGWMLRARPATVVAKNVITTEFPEYLGYDPDTYQSRYNHLDWARETYPDNEWGNLQYTAYKTTFVNDSATPTTFNAYPVIMDKGYVSEDLLTLNGHVIQYVGAGVYDAAQCSVSGKKFALAVNLAMPANVTMANHIDKIGERLFFFDLFHESVVEENNWNESFTNGYLWDEAQIFNQPYVAINEAGQPQSYFIDYNKAYDHTDPNGRYTKSSLPTLFTSDGRNVVSQFCLEDLYHHDIDGIEDFDQNLGIHVETDRDSGRNKGEPITQFNPVKGGFVKTETICDDWGWCNEQVTDTSTVIRFASATDDVNTASWAASYTAQPGEEVTIAAAKSSAGGFGIGARSLADSTNPKFLVLSANDDLSVLGYTGHLDEDGTIIPDVKQGQQFSLNENAENGTVVGTLELDTQGFFAYPETEYASYSIDIVGAIPGTPFSINDNHEIVVANSAALDFEITSQIILDVVSRQSNNIGRTAQVKINLTDVNDVAPIVSQQAASMLQGIVIEKMGGAASIAIDISDLFEEIEGQALTYSVFSDSIDNLSYIDGMIIGETKTGGQHTINITASDGVYETDYALSIEVIGNNSGGGIGFLFLLLTGFATLARRKYN
ncbi:S8 family serine peptidase [Thalassotalea litorea]|uniref:S8 family serine peptidase n=1 Tax=Thalassotalea litorea TaxID=2020715 RepID=UPI0037360F41